MVLNFNNKKQTIDFINRKDCGIILTDVSNLFSSEDDIKNLANSIDTLTLLKTVHNMNNFYKSVNSDLRIPTKILHKVLEAGLTGKPFTDEMLKEYFNVSMQIEAFVDNINDFKQLEIYVPYEIELSLLGFSVKEYNNLTEKQREDLHEEYSDMYFAIRKQEITVPEFLKSAKGLITKTKKSN